MNSEKIQNFLKDKKDNFKARVDLIRLTNGEVEETLIMIRRPGETVYENQRLIVPAEKNVFSEIKNIKGPAVLDIRVSDRNRGDNFVTIKKK